MLPPVVAEVAEVGGEVTVLKVEDLVVVAGVDLVVPGPNVESIVYTVEEDRLLVEVVVDVAVPG